MSKLDKEKSAHLEDSTASPEKPSETKSPEEQGGYDCEFVERPTKGLQTDCPICLLVLREPHQVTCCGYSYCSTCIARVEAKKNPCPTCNQNDFSVYPNKGLQRSLNEFTVRCIYQKRGCGWAGEFGELERHLNKNPDFNKELHGCQFFEMKCAYCRVFFQRRRLEAHENDACPQRPFSCDYCRDYASDYEDVVNKHWPVCLCYPLMCPNQCNSPYLIERQNLEQHVNKECPLTVINCDFHYAGCEVKLPREDMQAHMTEALVAHVSLLATHDSRKIPELQEELDESRHKIDTLENENRELKQEIAHLKSKQLTLQAYAGVLPIEFTLTNFKLHKQVGKIWHSPPFYTHPYGYKLCLEVNANGFGAGAGTHISVFTHVLRGDFDNHLPWPFQGHVTVQLLNQAGSTEHRTMTFYFSDTPDNSCSQRVTVGDSAIGSWGVQTFIPHTALGYNRAKECQYLKDDCLHFRVVRVTNVVTPYETQSLAIESLTSVAPVEFTLSAFEQHKRENDPWYSPPFYSHAQGYRMYLGVEANGYGDGKHSHLSVYVHLLRGLFDDKLKWPFRGEVTLELLNQEEDKTHHSLTIHYTEITPDCHAGRVTVGNRAAGWGQCKFISHGAVYKHYLKNDCLCFRVARITLDTSSNRQSVGRKSSKKSLSSLSLPPSATMSDVNLVPIELTLTNFDSYKREGMEDIWRSPPFYSHRQGYKMSLLVHPNEQGGSLGSHISIYLELLHGVYDRVLRWPFIGEFVIVLVNQLEDSGHLIYHVAFDENTPADVSGEQRKWAWGKTKFVAHKALDYNPVTNCQYLKNNCLQFRVCPIKFLW